MKPSERIKEIVESKSWGNLGEPTIPAQIESIIQYLDELAEKKAEYVPPVRYNQRLGKR